MSAEKQTTHETPISDRRIGLVKLFTDWFQRLSRDEPYRGIAFRGDSAPHSVAAAFDFGLDPAERIEMNRRIDIAVAEEFAFIDSVSGRPDRLALIEERLFGTEA